MPTPPSQEEVLGYFETLSNWGRLGRGRHARHAEPDHAGEAQAGGLADPGRRQHLLLTRPSPGPVRARWPARTRSPTWCRAASCTPSATTGSTPRFPGRIDAAGLERAHLVRLPRLDLHAHRRPRPRLLGGSDVQTARSSALVKSGEGAHGSRPRTSCRTASSRAACLLDVARLKGKTTLDPEDYVFPEDLEAAEEAQGVRVEEGDVLLPARRLRGADRGRGGVRRGRRPRSFSGYNNAALPCRGCTNAGSR